MQKFRCPEENCNSNQLYAFAESGNHGWKLQCGNSHEIFPMPETIIRAEKYVWIRFK